MRAGILQHLVVFDSPAPVTRTPAGGEIINWLPSRKAFAAIEPQTGSERDGDGLVVTSLTTDIRIRWSPWVETINPKWRIRHQIAGVQRIYNIQSIATKDLARQEVVFVCTGGANNG